MRIVLDTNCLIQSIPSKSPYRRVWDSILSGENVLCVSNEIIDEYSEIQTKNKFVDCAIAGNARYIVTNDHHYDILRNTAFPHVDVLAIDEFLALLNG